MQNLVLLETNKTIATRETERYWSLVGYVNMNIAFNAFPAFIPQEWSLPSWATKLTSVYDLHLTPWKTYLL